MKESRCIVHVGWTTLYIPSLNLTDQFPVGHTRYEKLEVEESQECHPQTRGPEDQRTTQAQNQNLPLKNSACRGKLLPSHHHAKRNQDGKNKTKTKVPSSSMTKNFKLRLWFPVRAFTTLRYYTIGWSLVSEEQTVSRQLPGDENVRTQLRIKRDVRSHQHERKRDD
ncbi:hypothetical protein KQX54_018366 [Cotesia glomerata]|uniref:Uncharacterized protein n=1 Tax=Cotesia glomerata TaxID=32391 RepID=A0AAV7I9D8_COTGL|nr:hypothetical protein KQX54_018366 [Cotesia glomerata]